MISHDELTSKIKAYHCFFIIQNDLSIKFSRSIVELSDLGVAGYAFQLDSGKLTSGIYWERAQQGKYKIQRINEKNGQKYNKLRIHHSYGDKSFEDWLSEQV